MERLIFSLLIFICGIASANADQRCVVTDPSGTPLNVRTAPYGAIVGALYNGAEVRLLDMARDGSGRPWAYIAPKSAGRSGWVFREYIDCE